MAHITTGYKENAIEPFFSIIGLWELSVAMATKPRCRSHHNFSYFELSLPKQHLYKIRVILLQWFWRSCHLKKVLLKPKVAWQPNKMATGHKTHELGRQSSHDHNCQIWFTSLHWLWRKCNLTIFPYKYMGTFCCHGNQTKRQITIILAILNCPYPSNICTK